MSANESGENVLRGIDADLKTRLSKHDFEELNSIMLLAQSWRTLTPDTAAIFNQIKAKGYKILGLTNSGTGGFGRIPSLEKWRVDELKNLGITFDKNFKNTKPGALDLYIPGLSAHYAKTEHPCFPTADNGIVFTCKAPKGEVLDAYLQVAEIKPKKIIFIDDRIKNLHTVSEYCKKANIEFIGYEYLAIREQAEKIKPNIARTKLQYKILELTKTWLSDAQADLVLAAANYNNH